MQSQTVFFSILLRNSEASWSRRCTALLYKNMHETEARSHPAVEALVLRATPDGVEAAREHRDVRRAILVPVPQPDNLGADRCATRHRCLRCAFEPVKFEERCSSPLCDNFQRRSKASAEILKPAKVPQRRRRPSSTASCQFLCLRRSPGRRCRAACPRKDLVGKKDLGGI